MYYPKEIFSINETLTRHNMRQYEERQNKMYDDLEKAYPNFHKMSLRERHEIIRQYEENGYKLT